MDNRTRCGSAVPPTTAEPYLHWSPQMTELRIVLIVSGSPFSLILPWGRSRIGEARRSTRTSWLPRPGSHLRSRSVPASRPIGRCGTRERDRPHATINRTPRMPHILTNPPAGLGNVNARSMNPTMVDMGNMSHWVDRSVWMEALPRDNKRITAPLTVIRPVPPTGLSSNPGQTTSHNRQSRRNHHHSNSRNRTERSLETP